MKHGGNANSKMTWPNNFCLLEIEHKPLGGHLKHSCPLTLSMTTEETEIEMKDNLKMPLTFKGGQCGREKPNLLI